MITPPMLNGRQTQWAGLIMINSLMYGAITNGLPKRERLVLFDNSGNNIGDEVTGGWTMRERITDAGVKAIQPYIYPNTLAMVQNESPSYCVLETINKLDLSEYSKVVIKCNVMLYEYGGGRQQTALFSDTSGLVSNCADVWGFDNEISYGVSVGRTDDSSRLFILDISWKCRHRNSNLRRYWKRYVIYSFRRNQCSNKHTNFPKRCAK